MEYYSLLLYSSCLAQAAEVNAEVALVEDLVEAVEVAAKINI
jgi:hypothetical protein